MQDAKYETAKTAKLSYNCLEIITFFYARACLAHRSQSDRSGPFDGLGKSKFGFMKLRMDRERCESVVGSHSRCYCLAFVTDHCNQQWRHRVSALRSNNAVTLYDFRRGSSLKLAGQPGDIVPHNYGHRIVTVALATETVIRATNSSSKVRNTNNGGRIITDVGMIK